MIFIGLLTDTQKRAGYFVAQDEDFVFLFHRANGNPKIVAIFDYNTVTIKTIREVVEQDGSSGNYAFTYSRRDLARNLSGR